MSTIAQAPAPTPAAGWLRPLGGTGLIVSAVTAGGGPLGGMPETFGNDVPVELGVATAAAVLASSITVLDTANGYSDGESERRIGLALTAAGGVPPGFTVITKVDPDRRGDFSGERVFRSVEESLERLGLTHLPLLHLHDPERIGFAASMAADGPVPALVRLRDEGVVANLGVAGGPAALLGEYVASGIFDVLLTHNRFTLVDRSADALIGQAHAAGMGIFNAAVFGGGILARGSAATTKYAYREAPAAVLDVIRRIEEACIDFGVPLAAAALQFSIRDPRIASTIVGFSRPERVKTTVADAQFTIPAAFWAAIHSLVPPPEYWLY